MDKFILFGAGKNIRNYIYMIRSMGDCVSLILDSSKEKQCTKIDGICIQSPFDFIYNNEKIIITCLAFDEVRGILSRLGLRHKEVQISDYIRNKIDIKGHANVSLDDAACSPCIIFDLCSYAKWGGAEKWNYTVASYLTTAFNSEDICLLKNDIVQYEHKNKMIKVISADNGVSSIIERIKTKEQIVFFNSFYSDAFFALLMLKKNKGENVKIITVVHNDYVDLYKQCLMFDMFVDSYLCVSKMIADSLINTYGIDAKKVKRIAQPIEINTFSLEEKKMETRIRIGMASRLTSAQKRCELIPKLIDLLEKKQLCYRMEIAGDGELFDYIKGYVDAKLLGDKIKLRGKLSDMEMQFFWKNSDIYVNLSDFEGTSLSMLEAMSYMCVPVLTRVSGVDDYIEDGKSGLIYERGDLEGICDGIGYLSQNREILQKMGIAAQKSVIEKCDKKKICETIFAIMNLKMNETLK